MSLLEAVRTRKHMIVTVLLIAGLVASCTAMQRCFKSGDKRGTSIYAACSAVFCIAATLSIFVQAMRHSKLKRTGRVRAKTGTSEMASYCASYSYTIRSLFLLLTIGCCGLIIFAYSQSAHIWAKTFISLIFAFCLGSTYRFFFTKILFTERQIIVEMKFFRSYRKEYNSIKSMRSELGNLKIRFDDGKNLNLPSSLGNPRRIADILSKRCHCLPHT